MWCPSPVRMFTTFIFWCPEENTSRLYTQWNSAYYLSIWGYTSATSYLKNVCIWPSFDCFLFLVPSVFRRSIPPSLHASFLPTIFPLLTSKATHPHHLPCWYALHQSPQSCRVLEKISASSTLLPPALPLVRLVPPQSPNQTWLWVTAALWTYSFTVAALYPASALSCPLSCVLDIILEVWHRVFKTTCFACFSPSSFFALVFTHPPFTSQVFFPLSRITVSSANTGFCKSCLI